MDKHLHLGCGDHHIHGATNVDKRETDATDMTHDLTEFPWPFDDASWCRITMNHVLEHLPDVEATLRECERILAPGGRLVVRWPMGLNERADPDHKHEWVWDTPQMYCGKRGWDVDVGLEVKSRDTTLHTHFDGVPAALHKAGLVALRWTQGAGRWQFGLPATSGEFTVVFQKPYSDGETE